LAAEERRGTQLVQRRDLLAFTHSCQLLTGRLLGGVLFLSFSRSWQALQEVPSVVSLAFGTEFDRNLTDKDHLPRQERMALEYLKFGHLQAQSEKEGSDEFK
jgi:hypothetical protein